MVWQDASSSFLRHAFTSRTWENDEGADLLDAELSGFVGAASGSGWNVSPPAQNGDAYGLDFDPGAQGDTDWANFRAALYAPTARNLVYFGHGGTTGLGYNPGDTNRFISAAEVGEVLNNIPAGQTNAHHFSFCFL